MSSNDTTAPSFADASAATRAMFDAPDTSGQSAEPTFEPAPAPQTAPVDAPTEGTTATEAAPEVSPLSWDSIDLSVLPEEQRKFVQEHGLRHSDYTRKTQELAEQRKQFEQFGDVETVSEAMTFVQNLQDPEFLRQLKADIETHLGGNAAGEQTQAPTTEQTSPGLDPAIQREMQEFREFKAQFEHQQEEAKLVDQMQQKLQTAEDAIRSDYPSYTQADIDTIYKISPAHGYDLFEAQKQYEDLRNHFTQGLIGNKGGIPAAANNVRSDSLIAQPTEINTLEQARAASKALFAAE